MRTGRQAAADTMIGAKGKQMHRIVAGLLLLIAAGVTAPAQETRKPFVPTAEYVSRDVRGWTVRVNRRLLAEEEKLGTAAVELLDHKLYAIVRTVPAPAVTRLRRVPIWLGVDDGHAPCAEYHPNRDWLVKNGYNPDKAKAVEIGNASRFLKWSLDQPSMVLHELGHAYHDQVLGFDHAEIRAAHRSAVESRRYEAVLRFSGGTAKAYALTDPQEYFAEATEAFFGTNDFYPFVRAELEKHDPEIARVVREAWGVAN